MSEEEILKKFYNVRTHMHDNYIIADKIEDAIAFYREIDPDGQIEDVSLVGVIHDGTGLYFKNTKEEKP
jgi:hypothetical protein